MSNVLAYSSISVINVNDGNGIVSSKTQYWFSDNGVIEPAEALYDNQETNVLTDEEGNELLGFTWYDTVPDIGQGMFLWTKTTFLYDNDTTSVSYSVSRWGQDGIDGKDGKDGHDGKDGIDGQDGNGISSTVTTYAVSPDGSSPPIDKITDENSNTLTDKTDELYSFIWSTTIPEYIPEGWYLWTKITIYFTDNTYTDSYTVSKFGENGKDGINGAKGMDAPKISAIIPEYRVSDSNLQLTDGYEWSELRPEVEFGKYLWVRYRTEFSNETKIYSSAVCDTTLSGVMSIVDNNQQAIYDKVWQTDISTSINEYDDSTGAIIRDRITSNETDINGIKTSISDIRSDLTTKAENEDIVSMTELLNETQNDINGFKQTVSATYATKSSLPEFIIGSQRNTTNEWLGSSVNITSLTDGQQIAYWLPFDGTTASATLNLTLANNETTGGIPIYFSGTEKLTNQYTAGNIIRLTYRNNVSINQEILSGWWCEANYDSGNTYDRIKYNGVIKASQNISQSSLCVGDSDGYRPLNGEAFNISYPLLYFPDYSILKNDNTSDGYLVYPCDISSTQNTNLISGQAIYIKGTLRGLIFTPLAPYFITQTVPTSEDNYHYMFLGIAFGENTTTKKYYLQGEHPIYIYKNGVGFVKIETAALTIAEQNSQGFSWLVKSGTSSTNFELTDRTAELVSNYINLNGLVTFNGLNSDTQNRFNAVESNISSANESINSVTSKVNNLETSLEEYQDETNVIIGSQNSSTGIFKGNAKFADLRDGQQITYWLPYDYNDVDGLDYAPVGGVVEKGAALELTLSTGANTDQIPCFFNGINRLSNQYSAGNIIRFVYRENVTLDNQTISHGWWADANYDSGNTFDRIRYQQDIRANSEINYNNIIVGYNGGYHNLNNGNVFDMTYPILWCGNTLQANATGTNNFLCIPFVSTDTQDTTWEVGKPVFIKGSVNGSLFTPVNNTPLTQIKPESVDGYQYILLGNAYSTTGIYLTYDHSIYQYHNGGFKSVSQIATETAVIAVAARTEAMNARDWIERYGSNATDILTSWTADATLHTTSIDGGFIKTHTITAEHLATDAIISNNFIAAQSPDSPYSASGTFLNLADGNIYTQNFGIDNISGTAYLNGQIIADSGAIGKDKINYWQIGTLTDYNGDDSAALIGHGTSYIQSGWWQISNNSINTVRYDSNNKLEYLFNDEHYYDYGMKVPNFSSTIEGDDAWLYIRKSVSDSIPTLSVDWNYIFKVDKDGNIYENGTKLSQKYASIDSVDSSFIPVTGGTISGNLTVQGVLDATATEASSLSHSLTINGLTWDGSDNQAVGVIGVAYGGTGHSSWIANRLLYTETTNKLTELSSGNQGEVLVSQGANLAPMWIDPSNLVSDVANSVKESLIIKLNNGVTEDTDMFTFDGSLEKNINITKSSIGLGNVDNTPDSLKRVAYSDNSGLADTATTALSANKITTSIDLMIGNTTKSIDLSSNITFTKNEISANATSSNSGWMTAEDKAKLDSITVDEIGTVSASSIIGRDGISVEINDGIATISHTNIVGSGNVYCTPTSTLTNGGSFLIPSFSYDANGHITATSISTITLPTISFEDTYDCRRLSNVRLRAGSGNIYGHTLVLETEDNKYESIVNILSANQNKVKNPVGFKMDKIYWYNNPDIVTANNYTSSNSVFETISNVDFSYCSNVSLEQNQSVYIVGSVTNGRFYLDNNWISQSLPSSSDNRVFIYIGEAVSSTHITMSNNHPVYEYRDGMVRIFGSTSKTEIESALGYDLEETYLKLTGGTLTGGLNIDANINSDSKTTGSLVVNGGVGINGDTHSNSYFVNDKVNIVWNETTSSLDFVFI